MDAFMLLFTIWKGSIDDLLQHPVSKCLQACRFRNTHGHTELSTVEFKAGIPWCCWFPMICMAGWSSITCPSKEQSIRLLRKGYCARSWLWRSRWSWFQRLVVHYNCSPRAKTCMPEMAGTPELEEAKITSTGHCRTPKITEYWPFGPFLWQVCGSSGSGQHSQIRWRPLAASRPGLVSSLQSAFDRCRGKLHSQGCAARHAARSPEPLSIYCRRGWRDVKCRWSKGACISAAGLSSESGAPSRPMHEASRERRKQKALLSRNRRWWRQMDFQHSEE